MQLDTLRKDTDNQWDSYFKALEWGSNITTKEIEDLAGNDADTLFVAIIEHNKPPLELLKQLQVPSTQESTSS